MAIDKFGRFLSSIRGGTKRQLPYLQLTSAGILDMGGKRIRQLADPVEDADSVNKKYLVDIKDHLSEDIKFHTKKAQEDIYIRINSIENKLEKFYTDKINKF